MRVEFLAYFAPSFWYYCTKTYILNTIRHRKQEKNTQKTIVKKAIGSVPRVFLTPTAPKYTEITYKSVSEEPAITDAQRPAKLSGPHFCKISDITAVDAPPESGRTSISGTISDGIPTLLTIGDKAFDK